jgi:hypothetical protein
MRYYKTYNFIAVFSVIAFVSFLGTVFFWSDPQGADAMQMDRPLPQEAVTKQTSKEYNRLPAVNFAANENISDEVNSENNDRESLFTQNSLGESSPIEISSSHSSDLASAIDSDTESITRIIRSGSADTVASAVAADASGTGDTSSSVAAGSGSSGTGSAGSSGTSNSGSSGASGSGSSGSSPSASGGSGSSGVGGGGSSSKTILEQLKELKPLPKVHYYWYLASDFVSNRNNEMLYELARITQSVCVSGEWVSATEIDNAVYTCARINKNRPPIRCSIGVTYNPWERKFTGKDPRVKGNSYYAEIDDFVRRMKLVKGWVAKSNEKYGTDVEISAVLLDTERFYRQPHPYAPKIYQTEYDGWNEAMCNAQDEIHKKALELFPIASRTRIEWYKRGMETANGIKFSQAVYFTGNEIMPTCSCALYTVADLDRMRNTYKKTCDYADTKNVKDVTPWVALAGGYYKPGEEEGYRWDWDYDLHNSYAMGAELNDFCIGKRAEGYPSYNRAKVVIFWPAPFHDRSPSWGKHFIEYCKGAASANEQIPVQ